MGHPDQGHYCKDAAHQQQPRSDHSQVTSGAIINLIAVDSSKVAEISGYLHQLWAETPVHFILAVGLLYMMLGRSSAVGIGVMIFLLPVDLMIAKQFAETQKMILAATDARIHITNEALINIRIIKQFAWEQRFLGLVDEKREVELGRLRRRYIISAISATVRSGVPIALTFLTFFVYTFLEKKVLKPSVAFTALSLFGLLRIPSDQLADMITYVRESKVSVDRVQEYLDQPETGKYSQVVTEELEIGGEIVIGFDDGHFSWGGTGQGAKQFNMIDLNVRFVVGQLNVVIGPTGSGKSSLLLALLGEMHQLRGQVHLPGSRSRELNKINPETGLMESVAYCAQQAWLVNSTVRENIVFASEWNAKRYEEVITVCSLQRDLERLGAGDRTLVGDKGAMLSGGQRHRICLARALYCNARYLLLDDILSALDSHTAKWVLHKALLGKLMYGRTCILVTHNTRLCLPLCKFAIALENGRITAQGSPSEIISSGGLTDDFSEVRPRTDLCGTPTTTMEVHPSIKGHEAGHTELEEIIDDTSGLCVSGSGAMTLPQTISQEASATAEASGVAVRRERRETGAIQWSTILKYLSYMGGPFYWMVAILCPVAQQLSQMGANIWIRRWANAYETDNAVKGICYNFSLTHSQCRATDRHSRMEGDSSIWNLFFASVASNNTQITTLARGVNDAFYLCVFGIIGIVCMTTTLAREGTLFTGSLKASRRVHRGLITSIVHAKFRFFDTIPLGRIMNRFSKDVESIDYEVAPVAVAMLQSFASIVGMVVVISIITPGFLIAGLLITILCLFVGKIYIDSSRDLKRLESVQRSPIYQHLGETLSGIVTIRAYGDERRFIRDNLTQIDTHNRPFLYLGSANRWLAFRVDAIGSVVSFLSGAFVMLSVGRVNASAAGLAMIYAVTYTESLLLLIRLYAGNEQNMNAVERIQEYSHADREAALLVPEHRPDADWPSKGCVEFLRFSAKYRDDGDLVLRHITFRILPKERVGILGKTGAGKSSLALALFRALEAVEGKILLDGVDIGLIGLQDLRENVVLLPQDSTLFTGSIRSNLDPFSLFTDEQLNAVLHRVCLIDAPPAIPSQPIAVAPIPNILQPTTPIAVTAVASVVNEIMQADSGIPALMNPSLFENKNLFCDLSSKVTESGSSLSQGQRQLLSLARAILQDPKVLVMDEATASMDPVTESKIHETIREIDTTIITIAHRLRTIIDYDKVLVLHEGTVVAYGEPIDLLSEEGSMFREMCKMSGEFDVLHSRAKCAHDARRFGK